MFRIGDYQLVPCGTCNGQGTIPCPRVVTSLRPNARGHFIAPGHDKPIPCPECKGKRSIAVRKEG